MKRKLIVANWKMNHGVTETLRYLTRLNVASEVTSLVEVAVAPPATNLYSAGIALQDSFVRLAAQNCFWEDAGAFTGEVSPMVLKELGCEFVIVGHSERRHIFGETSEQVGKKVQAVLANDMRPIFCVGEKLEERRAGKTFAVIEDQLRWGLRLLERAHLDHLVIAYEPVWAIGTGQNATPQEAHAVHMQIKKYVAEHFRLMKLEKTPVIYGGSVNEDNVLSIVSQEDVDGALIGGASLEADQFIEILRKVSE